MTPIHISILWRLGSGPTIRIIIIIITIINLLLILLWLTA